MSSNNVLIGCKLPMGLSLTVDGTEEGERITLNGANTSRIDGGYGITSLEKEVADQIFSTYAKHAAFKNKAVFTHGTDKVTELIAVAEDLEGAKTGVEGLNAEKPAPGLEPEEVSTAMMKATQVKTPPVRVPAKEEERAATAEVAQRKQK